MDMMALAKLILPPEEYGELREAVGLLEAYPESPVRRALTAYADYVVGRAF